MADEPKYQGFNLDETRYKTILTDKFANRKPYTPKDLNIIKAVIPGTIRKIHVKEGQKVNPTRCLLILEAMKMKNKVFSEIPGIIKKIHVEEGQIVTKNQLLIEFGDEEAKTKVKAKTNSIKEKTVRTLKRTRKKENNTTKKK